MRQNPNWPTCKSGRPGQNGYSSKHQKNFDLITKESFFHHSKKNINIKIPCPDNTFELRKVYDFTDDLQNNILNNHKTNVKVLAFHISDGTNNNRRNEPITFFLDGEVNFNEVVTPSTCMTGNFNIDESQGILIIVINDNIECLCDKFIFSCNREDKEAIRKPEEAGGGVIVAGP
ncbi:hypothetical protein [Tenacibaculum halocynthiae]|uniref:hypothetical protein n=1 Tax=Tenacibaculum halocynthiae TaxID=1254437 RepID=UPI0038957DFB